MLRNAGVDLAIASVTWSFAVDAVADKLGIVHRLGTTLGQDGTIGHVWPLDKVAFLKRLMSERGISRNQTAAAGDSAGDLPLLEAAGLAVFVGKQPIAGLTARALHLPEADLRDVAAAMLRW